MDVPEVTKPECCRKQATGHHAHCHEEPQIHPLGYVTTEIPIVLLFNEFSNTQCDNFLKFTLNMFSCILVFVSLKKYFHFWCLFFYSVAKEERKYEYYGVKKRKH